MRYWLLKSDPDTYGWNDLKNQPAGTDYWDGVRNYQARNFLKSMRLGDRALFYHSVVKPQIITGIVEIVREAYPDPAQFDPANPYFDPKSEPEHPRWVAVDVQIRREFQPPITREELKTVPGLAGMTLFKNSRLSVQPVEPAEWELILKLR